MKKYIFGIILLISPLFVFAEGVAVDLSINFIRIDNGGRGYIEFTDELIGTPAACGSAYNKSLSFDTTTHGGKSILSMALTAKATGATIYAKGSGKCGVYGVVEEWVWGRIN